MRLRSTGETSWPQLTLIALAKNWELQNEFCSRRGVPDQSHSPEVMDTCRLESIAEDRISHELQRSGFLVAKPKFDTLGTDLLVFDSMGDGVKFCRIQCKGRTVKSGSSHLKIPASYVTPGFIVLVCVDTGEYCSELFIFFASDIRGWKRNPDGDYSLSLSRNAVQTKFPFYRFDETKVPLIKRLIQSAETSGEFKELIYGHANIVQTPARINATGTIRMRSERSAIDNPSIRSET